MKISCDLNYQLAKYILPRLRKEKLKRILNEEEIENKE